MIIVNDEGQGIKSDEDIFMLQYKDNNIGIGLHVSKQIVENNGGELDYISDQ